MFKNVMESVGFKARNRDTNHTQVSSKQLRKAVEQNNKAIAELNNDIAKLTAQLDASIVKRQKKARRQQPVMQPADCAKKVKDFNNQKE